MVDEELVKRLIPLRDLHWRNWGFPDDQLLRGILKFGISDQERPKYAWTNSHVTVKSSGGERIDVKLPTRLGQYGIKAPRTWIETIYNGRLLLYSGVERTVEREAAILKDLRSARFPTFEPLQHLIKEGEKVRVPGILLTRYVPGLQNLCDILTVGSELAAEHYLRDAGKLLRGYHDIRGAHGDAWCGNFDLPADGNLLMHDFEFLVNPHMPIPRAKAKDLVGLAMSAWARYSTDPKRALEWVVAGYELGDPEVECVRQEVDTELRTDIAYLNRANHLRRSMKGLAFYRFVHGLDHEQVWTAKEHMQKVIAA